VSIFRAKRELKVEPYIIFNLRDKGACSSETLDFLQAAQLIRLYISDMTIIYRTTI
jgi:hypothetical protein